MQFYLEHNLAHVSIEIVYRGAVLDVPRVILDTGSATTLLSVDYVEQVGIIPEASDRIHVTAQPVVQKPGFSRAAWSSSAQRPFMAP